MVGFLTIGVVWLNHHRIFTEVHRVDGPLLVLNLLLWTALIPFPTAVVAEYLQAGGELAQTAVALYGVVFLLVALSFGGLFAWVTRDDRLLGQLLPRDVVRSTRLPGSASTVRSHGSGCSVVPGRPRECSWACRSVRRRCMLCGASSVVEAWGFRMVDRGGSDSWPSGTTQPDRSAPTGWTTHPT
jgi:Endosomal/lysosomal potassium channel TMEM175